MTFLITVFAICALIGVGAIGCFCGLFDERRDDEGGDRQ